MYNDDDELWTARAEPRAPCSVLRAHKAVAALPAVTRAIRRFADAPLLTKLKRAIFTLDSIAEVELLLATHSEDSRLDALEGRGRGQSRDTDDDDAESEEEEELWLPPWQVRLINDVFQYGAQHASAQTVDWALSTYPDININGQLWQSICHGRLATVQLLHPRLRAFGSPYGFSEDIVLNMSANTEHVETLDWIFTHRKSPESRCFHSACESAASAGRLATLQWIHANCGDRWSRSVLRQAAARGQRHVMDWIYETGADADVALAMEAVAKLGDIDTLIWLHDKYPENQLSFATMEAMAASWQVDVATRVLADFPERYPVVLGVLCGDLVLVKKLVASRRPGSLKKKEVKRAMHTGARYGRLDVLQWLSGVFKSDRGDGCYVPIKTLWSAVRCSHLDVICWVLEQKPELLTHQRLTEMHQVSVRQPVVKSNTAVENQKDDPQLVVLHWIDEQLHMLTYGMA